MKPDYEKRLERAIGDKLRALPELSAPDQIAARVLSALATRAALPWYRRSWQTWSPVGKAASLLLLFVSFGGLCLAGWKADEINVLARIIPQSGEWLSTVHVIWNTISVLVSAGLLVLKQLSPIFYLACAVVAAFTYSACIGLGTVIFRHTRRINL